MASSNSSKAPGQVNSSGEWINHNGALLRAGVPLLTATNRGFRYGDGLFETLLVRNGRIRLGNQHFDRLFTGMSALKFTVPATFIPDKLETEILHICEQNGHGDLARVRLSVYRGEGGLYDPESLDPRYLIESSSLTPADITWKAEGLHVDVYPDAIKSCDTLANLKSANFLPYVLAALHAREQGLDDCLVLNSHHRIADSTIANLFYVKGRKVITPPLSEAGVAGVMRRFLLSALPAAGFTVQEQPVTVQDLLHADEVFLTNAIRGIRWVEQFRTARYTGTLSRAIYDACIR